MIGNNNPGTNWLAWTVRVPSQVRVREIKGERVLLDERTDEYFSLDRVGVDMWNATINGSSIGKVLEHLQAHYPDVPQADLQQNYHGFITDLAAVDLLTIEKP